MNHLGRAPAGRAGGSAAEVLFVQGANPAVMSPDQRRVLRGLARDDLFTVVHEQVLTDTAALGRRGAAGHDPLRGRRPGPLVRVVHLAAHAAGDRPRRREPHERRVAAALAGALGLPGRRRSIPTPARCSSGWCSTTAAPKGRASCASRARRCSSPRCSRRSPTAGPGSMIPTGELPLPRYVPLRRALPADVDQSGHEPHDQLDPGRVAPPDAVLAMSPPMPPPGW